MDRHRWMRSLALAAALVVGLAACTSSRGSRTTGGTATQQDAATVLRQLVRCIRTHGAPTFPDGTVDANGLVHFPDSAPRLSAATEDACRSIFNRLPPQPTASPPVSQAEFQQWLSFARCMRSHGVPDWPDPNPDGTFTLPQDVLTRGKALTLPGQMACDRYNPDPNHRIFGHR